MCANKFSLQGKNALVICPENNWGPEVVEGLKAAGCKVFLAGPNEEAMKALCADGYYVYDHCTKAQALAMAAAAKEALGSIDVMVENSLYRIIQNMCGAEIVHEIIMVMSFLPLATVPVFGSFPVFLITSLLAAMYDGIFVMAQRYNRPRLVRIYEKQEAKTHE